MDPRWADTVAVLVEEHSALHSGTQAAPSLRFAVSGESMRPTLRPGDHVIIEPVRVDRLRPGDLVLVQHNGQPILHRFLGLRRQEGGRFLQTAGDRHWRADPPFPEGALRGRAVAAFRQGQPLRLPVGRWPVWRHRLRSALWAAGHHLHHWLPLLLVLAVLVFGNAIGRAAVTITSFAAGWTGNDLRVTWTTASEVDSLGFYVWRSDREDGQYQRVSDLIPAEGDLAGASYSWRDKDAMPGKAYYYKLEDISVGGANHFWGPVAVAASQPTDTATATGTATPTATTPPTVTATPTASSTTTPTASPSVPVAASATATPSRTPTRPPAASASPRPSLTATRRSPPTPTRAAPTSSSSGMATPPPTESAPSLPTAQVPASPSAWPSISPSATATDTPTPLPLPPTRPAPGTAVAAAIESSSSGRGPEPAAPSDSELAQVQRRLTWTLVAIGAALLGGLLLVALLLAAYALYRWGYLRLG